MQQFVFQNLGLMRTDVPIVEVHSIGIMLRIPGMYACIVCKTRVMPETGMVESKKGWFAHLLCAAMLVERRQK